MDEISKESMFNEELVQNQNIKNVPDWIMYQFVMQRRQ